MLESKILNQKEVLYQPIIVKIALLYFFISLVFLAHAQTDGDYRSKDSGSWKNKQTWEVYNNGSWGSTNSAPKNVPDATVTIQNGHVIVYDQNEVKLKNLVVEQGAKLYRNSASSNNDLIIFGNIDCHGVIGNGQTADKLSLQIFGESTTISGSGECTLNNISKNSNSFDQSYLVIDMAVELTTTTGAAIINLKNNTNLQVVVNPGASLTTHAPIDLRNGNANSGKNCSIALLSDETGYGSLLTPQVDDSDEQNTLVQRYLSQNMWHYIAAPVDNPTASVFNSIYLMQFDEPTGQWSYITNPAQVLAKDMQGFAAWTSSALLGNTTVEFAGPLNTGYHEMDLTFTASATHNNKGFNFVGNPYSSALDWDYNGPDGWLKQNVDDAVYQWNASYGGYGSYVNGFSVNQATNVIPAHQGFYVHCNSATGKLGVDHGAQIADHKPFFKTTQDNNENVLRITVEGNGYKDETLIHHLESATSDFDMGLDAYKMMGLDEAPQIFSITPSQGYLSINSQPAALSSPLGITCGLPGIYSLSWSGLESFSNGKTAYLYDTKTSQMIALKTSGTYSFSYDPADATHRFNLLFYGPEAIADVEISKVNVYSAGDQIMISSEFEQAEVAVFNMAGQIVMQQSIGMGQHELRVTNSGFYVVRLMARDFVETAKVFVK